MRTRRSFLTWSVGALAICTTGASRAAAAQKVRFAIVVAKDSPISDIAFFELKRLYKGETVNAAGKRLLPLNWLPLSDQRIRFDQAVLGMNPEAVSRYWIDRRIRGQSGAPRSLEGPDLVQRVAARLDGGICYVQVSDVRADVKIVRVDGKAPRDPNYPIEY